MLDSCGLTDIEFSLATRLYIVAAGPFVIGLTLFVLGRFRKWLLFSSLIAFLIAIAGWELWLTYGLAGGLPVDERRSVALSCAIPQNFNWLLNSLADVTMIWVGYFLVWLVYGRRPAPFETWKWPAFGILLTWCLAQNFYVEAIFYHHQIGDGTTLSWAPMHPFGSWFNPTLISIAGRDVTLLAQTSWVLMTPIAYWLALFFRKKTNGQ